MVWDFLNVGLNITLWLLFIRWVQGKVSSGPTENALAYLYH